MERDSTVTYTEGDVCLGDTWYMRVEIATLVEDELASRKEKRAPRVLEKRSNTAEYRKLVGNRLAGTTLVL